MDNLFGLKDGMEQNHWQLYNLPRYLEISQVCPNYSKMNFNESTDPRQADK